MVSIYRRLCCAKCGKRPIVERERLTHLAGGGKRNYCRQSSMFAYNGNYLSFREIALSYNLPSNWVRKAGLGSVMLSVTGQNLGYLTEAKHLFSPEKTDNNGGYPLPRTVILGVNVSF